MIGDFSVILVECGIEMAISLVKTFISVFLLGK